MRWRTQKLDHAAHKQLPGRGCRHGNEVAGTSSILLVFFSQRCQGRLRCGTVRTLTGTHLWHTNAQTSARSGSSQHDYMTPTVMPSVFAEEQTEKRKTLLFHGPRFRFVLWLWFDKPTHTYFVHYITLPVRKDNCNCKTHHSPEVWAGNTEDYTFVHSSAIYTNTAWMCNTLQQAVRAVSPASPAKTADALMQKNTGGWKRVTENKVQCFHSTTASLQRTSMSNTGTLEL